MLDVEVVVPLLQNKTWYLVLGAGLLVSLFESLKVIQLGFCKHARNLLDCHVDSVLFEQSGYLAHVERVGAVLIELLKHFFDVVLGLDLGCCLLVMFVGAGLETLCKPVFVITSL